MMRVTVELSGESLLLAVAELEGACEALGGSSLASPDGSRTEPNVEVELPDRASAISLAGRLAFAYRCVEFRGPVDTVRPWWNEAGGSGESAAIRWQGHERRGGGNDPLIADLAKAWTAAGGRIDLKQPQRRFWLREPTPGRIELGEEVSTDRPSRPPLPPALPPPI